jgi:hypothetical protein
MKSLPDNMDQIIFAVCILHKHVNISSADVGRNLTNLPRQGGNAAAHSMSENNTKCSLTVLLDKTIEYKHSNRWQRTAYNKNDL